MTLLPFQLHHLHLSFRMAVYLFYFVKPLVPQRVRFTIRHWYARPLKYVCASSWPVPSTCTRPVGWPGWPRGKRFAFVLSHDVERREGLARCRQLAELEMLMGVRSVFNFVPEGEYSTPDHLRKFLTAHGFEVGVHDLRHDGKLYRSHKTFSESAVRINHYLKAWNAVGFRAGFMRHNLEWLQELDIRYDASTFDYDPFEPQPDGMHTIFPFCVLRRDGTSYVELPYTLAQDSTLFLVLREKGIDIWKRKLDWVAEHGGLAFGITHPDYMSFDGRGSATEYSVDRYREFLEYVLERYGDSAWFATPREVEQHVRRHLSAPQHLSTPSIVERSGREAT